VGRIGLFAQSYRVEVRETCLEVVGQLVSVSFVGIRVPFQV
jgi:hypothetical protein